MSVRKYFSVRDEDPPFFLLFFENERLSLQLSSMSVRYWQ